jgi:hypothetical protein
MAFPFGVGWRDVMNALFPKKAKLNLRTDLKKFANK